MLFYVRKGNTPARQSNKSASSLMSSLHLLSPEVRKWLVMSPLQSFRRKNSFLLAKQGSEGVAKLQITMIHLRRSRSDVHVRLTTQGLNYMLINTADHENFPMTTTTTITMFGSNSTIPFVSIGFNNLV